MPKPQISTYLSEKIRILSFLAIIGVLMIHDTYLEAQQWSGLWLVQRFISSLSNCAVPFFFMVSGYFFCYKAEDFGDIRKGISRRFKSLLIPYIFWCVFFMVSVGVVGLFITINKDYYELMKNGDIGGFLSYCFWTPAAFHLWYVRDLFIVVLLSPLFIIPLQRWSWIALAIAYILFGLLQIIPIISWALWWFIAGASFGVRRVPLLYSIRPLESWLLLIGGCLLVFILVINGYPITPDRMYTIPVIIICILGFWGVYDALSPKVSWLLGAADFTFVIYCAHVPLINIIKKIFHPLLDNGVAGCALGYILSPFITIGVIIGVFYILKKYCPRGYSFITGGR